MLCEATVVTGVADNVIEPFMIGDGVYVTDTAGNVALDTNYNPYMTEDGTPVAGKAGIGAF